MAQLEGTWNGHVLTALYLVPTLYPQIDATLRAVPIWDDPKTYEEVYRTHVIGGIHCRLFLQTSYYGVYYLVFHLFGPPDYGVGIMIDLMYGKKQGFFQRLQQVAIADVLNPRLLEMILSGKQLYCCDQCHQMMSASHEGQVEFVCSFCRRQE